MKDILNDEENLLCKMNTMIVKLRSFLISAKLKKLTNLKLKSRNITRWSSTYEMMKRYVQLREFLPSLEPDYIAALSLSPSKNRRVDSFILQLKPLQSVNKLLQNNNNTVSDTCALFDAVIQKYSDTANRLSSSADIIRSPNFESVLVKIQRNNASALSREKSVSVSSLLLEQE